MAKVYRVFLLCGCSDTSIDVHARNESFRSLFTFSSHKTLNFTRRCLIFNRIILKNTLSQREEKTQHGKLDFKFYTRQERLSSFSSFIYVKITPVYVHVRF